MTHQIMDSYMTLSLEILSKPY